MNDGKRRIKSLSGLKVLAILAVYWIHTWAIKPSWGLSWSVSFFFCCSGFLLAYRNYDDMAWGGVETAVCYWLKKVTVIWPLHAFAFCMILLTIPAVELGTWKCLWRGCINLFLLQAWGCPAESLKYSFNGGTWFLSALLFCYFMAPLFIVVLRRIKTPFLLFAGLAVFRVAMGLIPKAYPGEFYHLDTYCSPVVRMIEFFCAMTLVPLCREVREWISVRSVTFVTVVEAAAVAQLLFASTTWYYTTCFDLVPFHAMLAVVVFSCDRGMISRLFACTPLMLLSVIELEFYVFHMVVFRLIEHRLPFLASNMVMCNVSAIVMILVLATSYHVFCAKRATRVMGFVFRGMQRILLK